MHRSRNKYLFIALILLGSISVSAQTNNTGIPTSGQENNPYSKFGIGEFQNGNNTSLRGMGNVTSAYESAYEINSDNPASYSFLQRTTFGMGATASSRRIEGAINGAPQSYA